MLSPDMIGIITVICTFGLLWYLPLFIYLFIRMGTKSKLLDRITWAEISIFSKLLDSITWSEMHTM